MANLAGERSSPPQVLPRQKDGGVAEKVDAFSKAMRVKVQKACPMGLQGANPCRRLPPPRFRLRGTESFGTLVRGLGVGQCVSQLKLRQANLICEGV
jgi:hypothetical protein